MATILLSSFMVRHPVGGVLSNNLQLLRGFAGLGHDVYLLEKAGYEDSCFDPERRVSGDDCTCGVRRVNELLGRYGLSRNWCYVDADGSYHGAGRRQIEEVIVRADVFIDRGLHRTWDEETASVPCRVLLDPDPGHRQAKMAERLHRGASPGRYDAYYTYGHNIGTPRSAAPTAGVAWRHMFHPVDTSLYAPTPPTPGAPLTTVTNWRPLAEVEVDGRTYGMKDGQWARFADLPSRVSAPLEMAVEGPGVPREELEARGWRVVSALDVSASYDSYHEYLRSSMAEFSAVKGVYAGLNVGWFSDRSAAYLAHGRPVIVQDNGISAHLPTGEGLFEVADVDEAAEAIESVLRAPERHSRAARQIAEEHLDATIVLRRFLDELGITSPSTGALQGGRR